MPSIGYDIFVPWANYHLTTGTCPQGSLEPQVKVEKLGRFHGADVGAVDGIERFAATAGALWKHVEGVIAQMIEKRYLKELGDPPKPFPAALVGRGWSFSNLIGADKGHDRESLLLCDGLAGSILLPASDLADASRAGWLALTGGGTRLRELLEWSARLPQPRSIRTSGTHLGLTVAGGFGTASHGSRLGYGGIQNLVAGMHIVTGLGDSVWIERASRPVLGDAAIARLNPAPGQGQVRVIRDDDKFDDALVHLGCMGIVNCVAVELVEDVSYEVFRCDKAVDAQWLQWVANGDWRRIASWLGEEREPVFYEATLDPHAWDGSSALHLMYFESGGAAGETGHIPATLADAVTKFAGSAEFGLSPEWKSNKANVPGALFQEMPDGDPDDPHAAEPDPPKVPIRMFDPFSEAESVYEYYRELGCFKPEGMLWPPGTWRQIHADEITGGAPGSLYNTSYAIRREEVVTAIPAIVAAVQGMPQSFVFTMRFVSNPAGQMAFTRFPECAVIEIDGLSPWICQKLQERLPADSPTNEEDRAVLELLRFVLPGGAGALKKALDGAGVDFSNHFAKRSFLDQTKIQRDFGPLSDPGSRLSRWRRTRDELLASEHGKAMFWNWGAVNFGLLDAPDTWPADVPETPPPPNHCAGGRRRS